MGGIILNATYIQDLVDKIKAGELKGESSLKLRNESAQTKIRVKRIDKLQKELKKRSKLFIPVEIAVPFDPMDGSEEVYHSENKFRPALSATSSALLLKALANENDDVKKLFMKKANVPEWDTTAVMGGVAADGETSEVITEVDKQIFRLYRLPRIFTLPVVTIKDSRITGRDYGRDYIIEVERNKDTGRVEGEMPIALISCSVLSVLRKVLLMNCVVFFRIFVSMISKPSSRKIKRIFSSWFMIKFLSRPIALVTTWLFMKYLFPWNLSLKNLKSSKLLLR
jgi:hypothetical protein